MTKTYTKFDISAVNISNDLAKDILDIVIAFAKARGIELCGSFRTSIQIEVVPGSYKNAKGALPWKEGDELPEDTVRRMRGGES